VRAALLVSPGKIEIAEVPPPDLGAGDVLIRVVRAGICGSDLSFYLGHRSAGYPLRLGHELAGQVAAVGPQVSGFETGQRVTVEPNYPCGKCALCLAGRGSICPGKGTMGVNAPGCFAEYVAAPAEFVWALPGSVPDPDGAAIEPLAVALHALSQSGARAGDAVAVVGCGSIGLLLIHTAASQGIRVIAHDRFEEKLARARRLGAVAAPDSDAAGLWREQGVTTVFECAGAVPAVEMAIEAAPRGSRVLLLGLSSAPARFTPLRLVREGIRIEPSLIYDHPSDFARALELVGNGALCPSCVVSETLPFDSMARAMELAGASHSGKVHVVFG
jgi:L-iditol 2-dehydrogenase